MTITNADALPPPPEQLTSASGSVEPLTASRLPAIPGHEVLETLGPGGMGIVFKARQLMPPRLVAIKMVKDGAFASSAARIRFRREAEAVAKLHHPDIVPIYEFGEQDGCLYFTMEYLDGGTLQQKLAGNPQPPVESARLVETLARAIHAAHLQGVIHRDLKPSNILLTAGSTNEIVPKIADFGLAKIVERDADLTPTQAVLGTVGYMPPEQASGKSSTIGPAADVYSLGAILYQMLTGRPPFQGESTVEVLLQVVREEPVPPRRLRASVPVDLETICLACLEKDPVKRYASALELAEDLRRFQANEPIERRPVGSMGRLMRWSRRNPALAFSGGLAIASLLVVTILSVIFGISQAQSNRELDRRRKLAELGQAENLLERGQTLAEQDEHGTALLAFARGLEVLPSESTELERVLRVNMGASLARQHRLLELFPHTGAVHGVVCSADGKSLITGCHDGKGRIWDIATGTAIPLPHADPVWHAVLSPDGAKVATASADSTAAIWDRHTGRQLFSLAHTPGQTVWSVAFSHDGQWLITGAENISLWSVKTGTKVKDLIPSNGAVVNQQTFRFARSHDSKYLATAHGPAVSFWCLPKNLKARPDECNSFQPLEDKKSKVLALAFGPKDQTLLTVCESSNQDEKYVVQVWDWPTLTPRKLTFVRKDHIHTIQFSSDGTKLLVGCSDGEALLFDSDDGRQFPPIKGPNKAHFHPNDKFILASQMTGYARLWETATGRQVGGPMSMLGSDEGVAFSKDGARMAIAGGNTLGLWSLNSKPYELLAAAHPTNITSVAFHPSGKSFLTVAYDGVRFFDTATGHELPCDIPRTNKIAAAFYSKSGDAVVCAGRDLDAIRYDMDGGRITRHRGFKQKCNQAALNPDGKILAGVWQNQIFLWDFETGTTKKEWKDTEWKNANDDLNSLVFVSAEVLATVSYRGNIKLWNVTSGELRSHLFAHSATLTTRLAASGNRLACGFHDSTVHILDWTTGKRLGNPLLLPDIPQSVAFANEGQTLVTAGNTLNLWDLATRRQLSPPLVQTNHTVVLAVSPDGRFLLSGGAHQNRNARLQVLPVAVIVPSKHAVLWSQVVTGLEADERGVAVRLSPEEWRRRREQLTAAGVRVQE